MACLERALHYFGGVPMHVLCDNPKTIVIERNAYGDGLHRYQKAWLDFVKHYGLRVKLCSPYRAQTKGKVERFHRYLRESFYNPLQAARTDLVDVALANREIRPWLDEIANCRIHATLKERPSIGTPLNGRSCAHSAALRRSATRHAGAGRHRRSNAD